MKYKTFLEFFDTDYTKPVDGKDESPKKRSVKNDENTGVCSDEGYRDEKQYTTLQDYLKGIKNVDKKDTFPAGVEKSAFAIEE